jgi:hypothetical protein
MFALGLTFLQKMDFGFAMERPREAEAEVGGARVWTRPAGYIFATQILVAAGMPNLISFFPTVKVRVPS